MAPKKAAEEQPEQAPAKKAKVEQTDDNSKGPVAPAPAQAPAPGGAEGAADSGGNAEEQARLSNV